ncbi:MAG: 2-polyprenyl-3-methyl-6-methoxy-1,4-benzoquinone monooxygenase [Limnobacter sp.]|jgi:ubiquinone biosynthesis monooxygenase Coq7|uniref:2-polyprenyl-3-methyl-6-methoxy-1,4-benzoquinone monooxygenase n=1 Tax=Limnobacter sp. 130 TaxID=2653147 RepID=UPI0012EFCDDC|nr:2-polyprenyl-3-methyl-6-methoxy-1,4-benzoquinone monooxygenase [Limnobacter sp. 130]VWX33054.1 2-nonaprenyl-3-methyl-6-methoxy-1,4-benzoquinol hydroxylase [Limnobacter sp. 130]
MPNQPPRFPGFPGLPALPKLPSVDAVLNEVDKALKTLAATPVAQRPNPAGQNLRAEQLSDAEKEQVIGLMRVNHVGEICAQALYQAQALASKDPEKKALFDHAAKEEADHLAWTQERLDQLGARPSLLNPFWYGGAFALGFVAGTLGDKVSLGFMAETEKQVEKHLNDHLGRLPAGDQQSRAILEQMRQDEIEHGQTAIDQGANNLPMPVKLAMTAMSKVMTTLAQKI